MPVATAPAMAKPLRSPGFCVHADGFACKTFARVFVCFGGIAQPDARTSFLRKREPSKHWNRCGVLGSGLRGNDASKRQRGFTQSDQV